jgi:hypothetical protein
MSANLHTVPELAGILGVRTGQVYAELQSFPHQGEWGNIHFTEDDVTAIRKIRAAGPEEQLKRYQFLTDRLAEVRALDEQDELAA